MLCDVNWMGAGISETRSSDAGGPQWRTDHRRCVRPLNKALFLLFRLGYPLDERFSELKLK